MGFLRNWHSLQRTWPKPSEHWKGRPYCCGIAGMVTKLVERSYRACEDDEDFDPARPSFSSALVEEQDEIEDEHEEE